jgi:RNA polymerase sigma-70 factor (ECF subfamily)
LAEIIAKHQMSVWRYLRLLGCDSATADDLTQETFLALMRQEAFEYANPAATASYLRRIAHNLYVSFLRRRKLTKGLDEVEARDALWDQWTENDEDQALMFAALRECLEKLTPRAQQALKLRFQSQSSRTSIGESLGITEHGAKNLMQRAKQQLRECIQEKIQ